MQGSIDKRRFADLGIKLDYGSKKNEITITYEFDRAGVTNQLQNKTFLKDFSNNAFRFQEITTDIEILTLEEKIYLLEFILNSIYKFSQKEIASYQNIQGYDKRISEHCKLIKSILESNYCKSKKISHYDLIKLEYEKYKKINKETCLDEYKQLIAELNKQVS